ncbi:MAG: TLD-domain-containing protein [Benjaminiella poitrasii]|nr:MAG: TLD-domain-containing protein [Benjaminiella poitrasii]
MGQSNTKQSDTQETQTILKPSLSLSTIETATAKGVHFKAKSYLSKVEYVSLKFIFNDLKSSFKDHFECIELKHFLEFLNLPIEIEPAAILLFKSLSYLGSYPECDTAGPVPLSLKAFITAFVIITGRLDNPDDAVSENLFFRSLSVLPASDEDERHETDNTKSEELVKDEEPVTHGPTRGLSLAELGIDFDDLDFDIKKKSGDQGPEILCRDLVEIFTLLLWLGEADNDVEHSFEKMRKISERIVYSIKPIKKPADDSHSNNNMENELPCISQGLFFEWKNASRLPKSRLLPEDQTPTPNQSDILAPLYTTLLSWAIPKHILVTKQWTRLYSADEDGFSMNRFESHVFKYPGPTLVIMQVDAYSASGRRPSVDPATWSNTVNSKQHRQTIILGAYVSQSWKHSKQFWGTNQCFLFELHPVFDVFRPVQKKHKIYATNKAEDSNDHYIYYHHDFGIGFGATNNQLPSSQPHLHSSQQQQRFIIYLQNTLQQGTYEIEAYPPQPSFESASISRKNSNFSYNFDTVNIEVFGLGNEKDREKQLKEWNFEKQEAARRAGVNIRLSDGQLDKELLKMAGIINEDMRQDR